MIPFIGADHACTCWCVCSRPGMADDGTDRPGWCDACRMNIHALDRKD